MAGSIDTFLSLVPSQLIDANITIKMGTHVELICIDKEVCSCTCCVQEIHCLIFCSCIICTITVYKLKVRCVARIGMNLLRIDI